jgi:hypothetical protein
LKQTHILEIDQQRYKINVFIEHRNGTRASITAKNINIRLPRNLDENQREEAYQKMLEWVRKKIMSKKGLHQPKKYEHGSVLKMGDLEFQLIFDRSCNQFLNGEINTTNRQIKIAVPTDFKDHLLQKAIGKLLVKLFKTYFIERFTHLVHQMNQNTVQGNIKRVQFRHTTSRWGSCNSVGHLSFAIRLLLAPMWVVQYVVIHELCHLREMNHSDRFWKLVETYCPNYADAERYLKENGHLLNF